ncbi:DUF3869 domain-containing protein [Bacteroides sp. 519]|uniref:DUF3869 domain-containing protein n=1 Tax=Bacteroides sp. 519 TaxID=2302937 RepID=UPI0013D188B5|nr:DUF3869 domain-containing protein [Bacteroides sp. 519]NDV58372.1 DUF3869 domain-containing protein [Bacteroides sp. 519]
MKMKSSFFGSSAKTALAILAVCGTVFTSCYEKEGIDTLPLGEPEYYVAGTITDANTGSALKATTITVGSKSVGTKVSTFKADVTYTTDAISVEVKADGYVSVTKQVYLNKVNAGGVYIADASVALVPLGAIEIPGVEEATTAETIAAAKTGVQGATAVTVSAKNITFKDPSAEVSGSTVWNTLVADFTNDMSNLPADAEYVIYDGFIIVGNVESTPVSRAVAAGEELDIFKAAVAAKIGKTFGFKQRIGTFAIPAWYNYSASGYRAVYNMVPRTFTFTFNGNDVTGTVVSQEGVTIYPTYFNHDTHTSHDGHGINPNAGGGSGSF